MGRLYTNEKFPIPSVEELKRLGHDVISVLDSDNAGKSMTDVEILQFAAESRRVLVTLNKKHFIHLHQERQDHHGIIVCTYNPDFVMLAQKIHQVLESTRDFKGKLIRVYK